MERINPYDKTTTNGMIIPTIQLELDDALDGRRCSILFPEKKSEKLDVEKTRNKRKSSFATFQIIDENNCGM